jgi:hypothetical protein
MKPTYPTLAHVDRPTLHLLADMAPMGTAGAAFTQPVGTMSALLTAVSTDRPTLCFISSFTIYNKALTVETYTGLMRKRKRKRKNRF